MVLRAEGNHYLLRAAFHPRNNSKRHGNVIYIFDRSHHGTLVALQEHVFSALIICGRIFLTLRCSQL